MKITRKVRGLLGRLTKRISHDTQTHSRTLTIKYMISIEDGYNLHEDSFDKMLACFREHFPDKYPLVYYPCSAHDPLAHRSFPDSRVIAVDMFAESVDALTRCGYEAYCADVQVFDIKQVAQKKADIILMLNPQMLPPEEFFASQLEVGGYCLCNNWSNTAGILRKYHSFECCGVIRSKNEMMGIPDDELLEVFLSDCEDTVWEIIENSTGPFLPFGNYLFIFKKIS